MAKPGLIINLAEAGDNIFVVITKARELVPAGQLTDFWKAILDGQRANKTFGELLAIIYQFVSLEDSSGTYPNYTPHPDEEDE